MKLFTPRVLLTTSPFVTLNCISILIQKMDYFSSELRTATRGIRVILKVTIRRRKEKCRRHKVTKNNFKSIETYYALYAISNEVCNIIPERNPTCLFIHEICTEIPCRVIVCE